MSCQGCTVPFKTVEDVLRCSGCKADYHYGCVNITKDYYIKNKSALKQSWKCPPCENITKRNKRKGDETPVRSQFQSMLQDVHDISFDEPGSPATVHAQNKSSAESISYDKFEKLLECKLLLLCRELKNEFNCTIERLKSDFTETTDFLAGQIADLKKEFDCLKKDYVSIVSNVKTLEYENASLRSELNDKEQAELRDELELSGIPEYPGESVVNIAVSVASKLGITLEPRDVVGVFREGKVRSSTETADGVSPRPRRLVVKLARRPLRDQLLKAARVRRGFNSEDLGLPQHEPVTVFVNERLTPLNRRLLGKAREAKRTLGWKYVWTSEGRVLTRRDDSAEVQPIKHEKDVERVFGKTFNSKRSV